MVNASLRRRGDEQLGRFLLMLDRRLTTYHHLRRGLRELGISERTFYRWKNKKVVPRVSALRRHCLNIGFDTQYVLLGIPHETGEKHRTLPIYQTQYREARSLFECAQAFVRIATESYLVLLRKYPKTTFSLCSDPLPRAKLVLEIEILLRFELEIGPTEDGFVDFKFNRLDCGVPRMMSGGRCDEGTLHGVLQQLRENIRARQKEIDDNPLVQLQKLEGAYLDKHNGRYD